MKAVDTLKDGSEYIVELDNFDVEERYGNCNYPTDTYADKLHKDVIRNILLNGRLDHNPRPHYADGIPAHTLSINHVMHKYDISKGQLPLITLRPIATGNAKKEILWIYQDASNDLDVLANKYGITWWDSWKIKGANTIGQVYGATVNRYDLMHNLLNDIKSNPDGRRHIMSLWQYADFEEPHGLKPCCYLTTFNVRHEEDGDYLDMSMHQRSADFLVAHSINLIQYVILMCMVARHCGYKPGVFTWFADNVQIYDRHIAAAEILYQRHGIECSPSLWINPEKTDFYDMTMDDIKIIGYPMKEIKEVNPQLKFDLGI